MGWHFPSDVIGAFLMTIAWAAIAALVAGADGGHELGGRGPILGAVLGLAGGLADAQFPNGTRAAAMTFDNNALAANG